MDDRRPDEPGPTARHAAASTADVPASGPRRAGRTRPTQTWSVTLENRYYELDLTPGLSRRIVVRVDGKQVYDKTNTDDWRTVRLDGARRIEVRLSSVGGLKRATVHDGDAQLDMDAPAGSRAARRQEWGRQHPVLYALRHVVGQGAVVLVAVLGLGAVFSRLVDPIVAWVMERLPPLPSIDLPDLPRVDLPTIPWPDIDLPGPPAWLAPLVDLFDRYGWIVQPLVIGVLLALMEVRRQRKQRAHRARETETGSGHHPENTLSDERAGADDEESPLEPDDASSRGPQSQEVTAEVPRSPR